MSAERLFLTTDAQGCITELPQFEPNQEVELIALFSKKQAHTSQSVYRKPPVELAGKVKILTDVFAADIADDEAIALAKQRDREIGNGEVEPLSHKQLMAKLRDAR